MTSYYANPDDPALVHLGRTLGEDAYELRTVLGRGGGATVFGALAIQRKQFVAVKLADRGVEGPRSAVEAVVLEAQRLRSMRHPHLIPVLESGVDDGVPYYVMPLAANGSLKQLLVSVAARCPWSWRPASAARSPAPCSTCTARAGCTWT